MNSDFLVYFEQFDQDTQVKLKILHDCITSVLPKTATTKISYRMPTFYYLGNLVHFAAFKNHISFFIGSNQMEVFKDDLSNYQYSKSGFHINKDQQVPCELVKKIVQYRILENEEIAKRK